MICFASFRLDTESRQFLGDRRTCPIQAGISDPRGEAQNPRPLVCDRSDRDGSRGQTG